MFRTPPGNATATKTAQGQEGFPNMAVKAERNSSYCDSGSNSSATLGNSCGQGFPNGMGIKQETRSYYRSDSTGGNSCGIGSGDSPSHLLSSKNMKIYKAFPVEVFNKAVRDQAKLLEEAAVCSSCRRYKFMCSC